MLSPKASAAVVLVSMAALAAHPARAGSGNVDKAASQCERGFAALESGSADQARRHFEKALKVERDYPEGHLGLGHVAMAEQRYEDALAEYEAARDAYAVFGQKQYQIEVDRYNELKAQLPKLRQTLIDLQNSVQRGDASERDVRFTITEIEQQIRDIDSLSPPLKETAGEPPGEVFFRIGNALSRLQRWAEALQAYEEAVARSPEFGAAYNNLALAYWRNGRLEQARDSLARAEALGAEVNPRFKSDLEKSIARKGK